MRVSLVISALDRATAPIRRIKAGVAGLAGSGGLGRLISGSRAAGGALNRIGAGGLVGRLRGIAAEARRLAGRAGLGAISIAGRAARSSLLGLAKFGGKAVGFGAAAGIGLLGFLTGGVLSVTSKFEQFQIVLENTEGSAAKARRAMAWVKQFARTTPYEVDQVMDAFAQLRLRDFNPMKGTLEAAGNAASALSQPLGDAVDALASAVAGEYEPLRRFGIRVAKDGNKLVLSYTKNGKQMKRTAEDTAAGIEQAASSIWGELFPNMMKRQSGTLAGLWSNIKDSLQDFQLQIGQSGFFDVVKGKVQQLLDWITKLSKNGTLERWANKISDALSKVVEWLSSITAAQWAKLGNDLLAIGQAIWTVANATTALINAVSNTPRWIRLLNPAMAATAVGARLGGGGSRPAPAAARQPVPRYDRFFTPPLRPGPPLRQAPRGAANRPRAEVTRARHDLRVRFENAPAGMRVTRLVSGDEDFAMSVTRGRTQPA